MRRPIGERPGFALLTTLVVVAAALTLAAVIAVNLRGYEEEAAIRETVADLLIIEDALSGMREASSVYPLQISHLASLPTTADRNSCGVVFTSGNVTNWQTKSPFGPFYRKRTIPVSTGWVLGIGVAIDTLVRNPPTTSGAGTLTVRIPAVSEYEAYQMDTIVDAGNGRTAGKVQWTPESGGRVDTLKFVHTRGNSSC